MAKDASIKVMLEFQANNASLSKATKGIANELSGLQRKTATVASSMTSFVPAFAAVGAAAFSAFSFAGRAAVQFQDSFAGVRKTLNFTGTAAKNQEENFKSLAASLVDISRTSPMAANELARIGEIGGQLGISAGSISKFTKTISQLTVATTMSAEEASFALSRLAAITRLPERNLGNLASVLVRLGNEFAATEGEIVNTAMKIASALELLESPTSNAAADSLALAAALKQVGQQTQAGSTAVARSLDIMATAVLQGGRELSIFAKVAGMTSGTFKQLAEASPAQAFVAFLEGLQAVGNAGADTVQLLDELGLGQQRTLRALRSMALASDDVKEALSSANEEFALNNALQTEAEKRFETVVSQIGILRNNITALGIETGNTLLGPLNSIIQMFTTIAGGTTAKELKNIAVGFTGVAFALNGLFVARKKMNQLNQVAMEAGMLGTGLDQKIGLFGDVLPGTGEMSSRIRANRLMQQTEPIAFNAKNFLAQQASIGSVTRGFDNIFGAAQVQGIDLFDAQANAELLDLFDGVLPEGDPSEIKIAGPDGEEQALTARQQDRLALLQAITQEEQRNTAINERQVKLEEERRNILAQIQSLEKDLVPDTGPDKKVADVSKGSQVQSQIDLLSDTLAESSKMDLSDADKETFKVLQDDAIKLNTEYQMLQQNTNDLIVAQNDLASMTDTGTDKYEKLSKTIDNLNNDIDLNNKNIKETSKAIKENVADMDSGSAELDAFGKDLVKVADGHEKIGQKSTQTSTKQQKDLTKTKQKVDELKTSLNGVNAELDEMNTKSASASFLGQSQGIAKGGAEGMAKGGFGGIARNLGPAIQGLAGFGAASEKAGGSVKALLKVLFMKRKTLMANQQAMLASTQTSQSFKVAMNGLATAIMGVKAAVMSLLASFGFMIAFTGIMTYLMKLFENSKKTAAAIREIGDEIKAVIDLQDDLVFQDLQRDMIEDALQAEMSKRSPDQTLIDTFQKQLDDIDSGIAQARFNIEQNMIELGKALMLETTEDGVNVEARLAAISKQLGNTFDLDEFFAEVGKQITDFEGGTSKSLLRTLQNLQETEDEIAAIRAQPVASQDLSRLKALEEELVTLNLLDNLSRQTGNNFENIIEAIGGSAFGRNFQDTFTGSLIPGDDVLNDNIAKQIGLDFEELADGSVQIFARIEKEFTDMYGNVSKVTRRQDVALFGADMFTDSAGQQIDMDKVLDDLSAFIILSDTVRRQAQGKEAKSVAESNSTFIQMQNEGLIKQMQFLKQNGVILQDIDPYKDRERAIREVTTATNVYQNMQIQKAQQSAKSLGILEFQMSKFEKALNESLQRSAGTLASIFTEMPLTVRKGVDEMLNEMFIKEARLKNFQNDVKRLSTIAPMLAKNIADQGLAARQILTDVLQDPVAAFSLEASMVRIAPFNAEKLGLSEQEIEKMEEAGLRLGDSASEGIIVGIQNRQAELEKVLISSVKGAIDATKYSIDSSSPSKLTAEMLGEPLAQGIAMGIFNEDGTIKEALTTVIDDAISEAELMLMTTAEGISELSRALATMFAVTAGRRALTAATYNVQKAEQALMATRRKNATLQERISKNQIALQKAELEGRKNNITMSEEMNILQQKVAIDEMKRVMSGKKTASERKAIADAEKELEELRLAAEAGIVDSLDVEVAEEKLAEMKGTNKTIEQQRIEILQLAEAEKKLQETEKEAREVDQNLIALREENVKLLDEAANESFELQTAYDNLEAATEGVFTAEMKYAEARDKFDRFVKASPELFDALKAGYGGVGGAIDGVIGKTLDLVNKTETGADRAVVALQKVVTEANRTAAHLSSLDLLENTAFDGVPDDAMRRRNLLGTYDEFVSIFADTPLGDLLANPNAQSAVEAGTTSGMDRSVFSDIDDFRASEAALQRSRKGGKIRFADFARAIQSKLGIAVNLDKAGNLNFSEEQLQGLGITDTASIASAQGTGAMENLGSAVLSVGGGQLGEMGDLSRQFAGENVTFNYNKIPGLGMKQDKYNIRNAADLIALFNRATGSSNSRIEPVLEALGIPGLPGAIGRPGLAVKEDGKTISTSDDHRYRFNRDINTNTSYRQTVLKNVMTLLDTLGEARFGYELVGRKMGGTVKTFQRALVGEYGPEFVTAMPGGGLRVTPQGSERGGSINVDNLNVNVTGVPTDPVQARKAAVQIQKALVKLEKEGVSGTGLTRR